MGEGGADTAAIEIDHAALLVAREDDAPAKGVSALRVNQPRAQQQIQRITEIGQMTPQVATGSIAEAQFGDQVRILEASLLQILGRFGVALQLHLVKNSGSVEYLGLGG